MITYIARRLGASLVVLLSATFLLYMMLAYALDPLVDLRTSSQINKAQLIEARIRLLNLDTPPIGRYFIWLKGVVGYLWGQGTLGASWVTSRTTEELLGSAIGVTLRLVAFSAVLAILLGVAVGILSALRQYSGFDYSITFVSFLLYSLPTFWVAVLLKQWGAIGFNDFLSEATISLPWVIGLSIFGALIWSSLLAGTRRKRLITAAVSGGATAIVLVYINVTDWLVTPGIGIVVLALSGIGAAYGFTALTTGLRNRRVLYSGLTVAGIGTVLYYPLQFTFRYATTWLVLGLLASALAVAFIVGWFWAGPDRRVSIRVAMLTATVVAILTFVDRVMDVWQVYTESSFINGRPIATLGASTPGLKGDFWVQTLDQYTHLILPATALLLISFASYTRYSRASLLEVMNQDYVRTARAKGLPERVVVLRHAFRNALIPLATIIPLDIAGVFSGAIITESIFGWTGMGNLFLTSIRGNDMNPVMGYFLVTGTLLVLANLIADLVYAGLDPRIRVAA